jgi:hypothetical protein
MGNFQTAGAESAQPVQIDPNVMAQFQAFQQQQAAAQAVASGAATPAPAPDGSNYDAAAALAQLLAAQNGSVVSIEQVQEQLKGLHEAVAKRVDNPIELAKFADAMIQEKRNANGEAARKSKEIETLKQQLEAMQREKQEAEMSAIEKANAQLARQQQELQKISSDREAALARQYEAEVKLQLFQAGCNEPDFMVHRLKEHLASLEEHEVSRLNLKEWIAKESQVYPRFFGPTQTQVRQEASAPLGGSAPTIQYEQPQVPVAHHGVQPVQPPTAVERQTQSVASTPMQIDFNQANMNPQLVQQMQTQQMMQAMIQQQALQAQQAQAQQQAVINPAYQQQIQRPYAQTGAPPVAQVPAAQQVVRVADVSKSSADFAQRDGDFAAFKAANGIS